MPRRGGSWWLFLVVAIAVLAAVFALHDWGGGPHGRELIQSAAGASDEAAKSEDAQDNNAGDTDANEERKRKKQDKWEPPVPTSAGQRVDERRRMVDRQIARPPDGRTTVTDKAVLEAMRTVPRHVFVPDGQQRSAYGDFAMSIGQGQTISQPYIVASMTELLKLTPKTKVLEIGTGSGYQAAVLAQLTPWVYSIEIIEPLAKRAENTLKKEGYDKVHVRRGDGYLGWEKQAPFDAIIVTCQAGHLPPPLWKQLKPGGRIVIPIGPARGTQRLVMMTKTTEGERRSKTVMLVRFVSMTGRIERGK